MTVFKANFHHKSGVSVQYKKWNAESGGWITIGNHNKNNQILGITFLDTPHMLAGNFLLNLTNSSISICIVLGLGGNGSYFLNYQPPLVATVVIVEIVVIIVTVVTLVI